MSKVLDLLTEIVTIVSSTFTVTPLSRMYDIFTEFQKSNTAIDVKINKAYNSLVETSNIIHELEQDLIDRNEKVIKLKEEYEKYQTLSKIKEEEAKPLMLQIAQTIGSNSKKETIKSIAIGLITNLIIFILGVWLGPCIQKLFGIN